MAQSILTPAPTPMAFDQADRDLLASVRPPDWANPQPAGRYDLVVLGAGSVTAASPARTSWRSTGRLA